MAPPENSVTNSCADCALTDTANARLHQGHQPLREERVGKLFLDLHTVSAPSGEERTLGAAAQVERTGRCCRRFDGRTHAWCGRAAVMVLVPSASGPRVRGVPRAFVNFRPYPVDGPSHGLSYI